MFLVLHLMIAGVSAGTLRLAPLLRAGGARIPAGSGSALDFSHGTLILTEAGTKRQASLFLVSGRATLADHDRAGSTCSRSIRYVRPELREDNHTLKRAITDRICSAVSAMRFRRDTPRRPSLAIKQSGSRRKRKCPAVEATRSTLTKWIERLRRKPATPSEKVTASARGWRSRRYREPARTAGVRCSESSTRQRGQLLSELQMVASPGRPAAVAVVREDWHERSTARASPRG